MWSLLFSHLGSTFWSSALDDDLEEQQPDASGILEPSYLMSCSLDIPLCLYLVAEGISLSFADGYNIFQMSKLQ